MICEVVVVERSEMLMSTLNMRLSSTGRASTNWRVVTHVYMHCETAIARKGERRRTVNNMGWMVVRNDGSGG